MKEIYEIRFHGRGGQGAKTASALLASAALGIGKHIQSFPEYGAERQGAPVRAYTRISDKPITIHCAITQPDMVVVIDETLLKSIPVTEGLQDDGILIVNTHESPAEIKQREKYNGTVATVDATKISIDCFGRNIPNMPMVGAILKAKELVGLDAIEHEIRKKLGKKVSAEIVQKNINALHRAYEEVKIE
ncbi:2-oxoacid:acceptor oxidoreductase family protein [Candidatus Woesearchaeota archaeon]|nr:2-oxoacid:acceptor oxidoreductase family protein [Candidatus Woesearchaeota archaeon]